MIQILFVAFFLIACNPFAKDSKDENSSFLLLALAGRGSISEPRPFRWRTVSVVGENRKIHVYDWNFEQEVLQLNPSDGTIANVDSLYGSTSGRFAYAKVGSEFEIVDSTMNLSPHGDHFHYDRENSYLKVRRDRFHSHLLNSPPNTTPYSARSKSGWVGFLWKGNGNTPSIVRFVQEKLIGELPNNIPVWNGPVLGNGVLGEAILISGWTDLLTLVPTESSGDSPTEFQVYSAPTIRDSSKKITGIGSWSLKTSLGALGTIACPEYQGVAATQIPSQNADFTDLENGYSMVHYLILSCGTSLQILTHNDETNGTTLETLPTEGRVFHNIRPLFQNENIERGARDSTPLFLASSTKVFNEIFLIDPRSSAKNRIRPIRTVPYLSHLFGSDTRSGAELYVVSDKGRIYTYDTQSGRQIRSMPSQIPLQDLESSRFYGTWFGTALMTYQNRIQEFNLRENFKARVVNTEGTVHRMSLKGFFAPGADYDGPPHASIRKGKQTQSESGDSSLSR